jgi:hypothetical protein
MTTPVSSPVAPGVTTTYGLRVPWATVLPLAVVAAFGSGFWIIALRGAAGAVERTSQAPFTAWLRESTLLLPLYVFAVLAALTLAQRWFGGDHLRARQTAATFLLVVAAATVAGTVVLAASSAYDYQLQIAHLAAMNATHGPCDTQCLAIQEQSTLDLQLRAVGLGSLIMLASNLVLLALVVAFRGGRIDVASPQRARRSRWAPAWASRLRVTGSSAHARHEERASSRLAPVELFLVAGLLGAAAIHATVIPAHLAEWPAAGVFFIVLTIAELDAAGLVFVRLRSAAVVAAMVVSVGPILLWLYSRTAGLPFGPEAGISESVGLADVAASLLEVGTLAMAVAALRSRRQRPRPDVARPRSALALVALLAVTVLGVAGGLGLMGGEGHAHPGHAHEGGVPTG